MIFSAFYLFHVDAGRFALRFTRRLKSKKDEPVEQQVAEREEEATSQPSTLSRREVLVSGAAVIAGPTTSTYASLLGRHDYEVEEVEMRLPGWPRALDGYTIVQISDIHIGTFVGDWELRSAVDLIRQAQGDLVVMTGDLLDHDASYAPRLGQLVEELVPLARDGVAACVGNHDYYAGVEEVKDALHRGGARILQNKGVVLGDSGGSFALLGVDDLWAQGRGAGPDLDAALRDVPPDLARVLLCHQPEFFHDNAGHVQLQLSGHTHGGQVSLGYNPAYAVLPHGYIRGEYEKDGGQLYVNRGFGTAGPPARLPSS